MSRVTLGVTVEVVVHHIALVDWVSESLVSLRKLKTCRFFVYSTGRSPQQMARRAGDCASESVDSTALRHIFLRAGVQ